MGLGTLKRRSLRSSKGAVRSARRIRFGASAWVGPSFREGERRIVLLTAVSSWHGYYTKARWASLEAGKIDLFIADKAIVKCTTEALSEFLKRQLMYGRGAKPSSGHESK